MGWPGIVVDWAIQKPERWGESLATAAKLRERYDCPIWASADRHLTPLKIMNQRYLRANYFWLERKLPEVDREAERYRRIAGPGPISVSEAMYVADRFNVSEDEILGELDDIYMAGICAESWEKGAKWMRYSMDVLTQWARDHGMTLRDGEVA